MIKKRITSIILSSLIFSSFLYADEIVIGDQKIASDKTIEVEKAIADLGGENISSSALSPEKKIKIVNLISPKEIMNCSVLSNEIDLYISKVKPLQEKVQENRESGISDKEVMSSYNKYFLKYKEIKKEYDSNCKGKYIEKEKDIGEEIGAITSCKLLDIDLVEQSSLIFKIKNSNNFTQEEINEEIDVYNEYLKKYNDEC